MSPDPWAAPQVTRVSDNKRPAYGSAAYEEMLDRLDRATAIICERCGYQGQVLRRHDGLRPRHLLLVLIGIGPLLIWMATRATTPTCPQCGETKAIDPSESNGDDRAQAIWREAELQNTKRLRRARWTLLGSLLFLTLVLAAATLLR